MKASSYSRAARQVAGGQVQSRRCPGRLALSVAAALQEAARSLRQQLTGSNSYGPLPPGKDRGKVKP